ncbi:hypothetical protein DdX_19383 [Ditylenchus destructor]|uniref:Uncharacterized protein n=1 Tax=Ditylenchus destructor TaxID=166010 RepID=A0AAD4QX65_9BILA|nr:hypothetical protein DdX_19383 [Ditylenchus destructor]
MHLGTNNPCLPYSLDNSVIPTIGEELHTVHFPDLLKWLTRNVRAETLTISLKCDRFASLANFLLDPSGAKECASNKVKIDVSDPVQFLSVLIKKFRASPLVEDAVPTIEFLYPFRDDVWEYLRANLIDQEVVSLDANALYTVSNGKNRMRISLCKSSLPNRYDCEIKIDSI